MAVVFSFAAGIIHPYYTVALAPAIGALMGIGTVLLWQHRAQLWARLFLAGAVGATGVWAAVLLGRSATFLPGLAGVVAALAIIAAIALVALPMLRGALRIAVIVVA